MKEHDFLEKLTVTEAEVCGIASFKQASSCVSNANQQHFGRKHSNIDQSFCLENTKKKKKKELWHSFLPTQGNCWEQPQPGTVPLTSFVSWLEAAGSSHYSSIHQSNWGITHTAQLR